MFEESVLMRGGLLAVSRCRSCSSYASFSAHARQQTKAQHHPQQQEEPSSVTSMASSAAAAAATTDLDPASASASAPGPPPDCPADVETLGRSTWTLLHTMAATYPERPSASQQSDLLGFVRLFSRLYPCWSCAQDFQAYIGHQRPAVASRGEFGTWLCGAHNDVNRRLGKPEFDCSRWEERWRTGWKDGRCD